MPSDSTLARLQDGRLVVVARRLALEHVTPVAEALVNAGVPALEITLDEPAAVHTIAELHATFGDRLLIGAGTALYAKDVEASIAAGADFVVSPVFIPAALEICREANVLYVPGGITPADMFNALNNGARAIKIFPASLITPVYIRDILEPFRELHPVLMLTGGLDAAQIPAYLAAGISIVGVGGAILEKEMLTTRQYEHIGEYARKILAAIREAS